jgi:hypothetical protein
MGRVKLYNTSEDAKVKQKEQIKKANEKYRAQRKEFRNKVFNEQLRIIKLLNKNVVDDQAFMSELLTKVEAKIGPAFLEIKPKPKKEKPPKDPNAPKKPRAPRKPKNPVVTENGIPPENGPKRPRKKKAVVVSEPPVPTLPVLPVPTSVSTPVSVPITVPSVPTSVSAPVSAPCPRPPKPEPVWLTNEIKI